MSLWAQYILECGVMKILEYDWGFITYQFIGDEVWSGDCYVIPAERKSGKAHELIKEMFADARENGCKFFCARVSIKSKKGNDALVSHLREGCILTGMDEHYYYVRKEL